MEQPAGLFLSLSLHLPCTKLALTLPIAVLVDMEFKLGHRPPPPTARSRVSSSGGLRSQWAQAQTLVTHWTGNMF